jgi:hypothetical protein
MAIRVRIVRATVGTGGVLAVGQVLSLPDAEARELVARGKAVAVLDTPDGAAPVPQHADPVPARARSGR